MVDEINEASALSDTAQMLVGVDQGRAWALFQAFDQEAKRNGAQMSEAMWAVAMLQARILAGAELGGEQMWAASRFADMVRVALPPMMMAVERSRREATGEQPYDA